MSFLTIKNIISVLFTCLLTACSDNEPTLIQASTRTDIQEVRLGGSNYYLRLPANLKLIEARGKEGQLGYNILPKDTSAKMFGFIEIENGHPIGGTTVDMKNAKEKVKSTFLNKQITWSVYQTKTGYFVGETPEGEVSATVLSNKRSEVDSLISIIATLRRK